MAEILNGLQEARKDLLDLSLRNRLLNFRALKTKGIQVIDEMPDEVFRILVSEERKMSFLAIPEELEKESEERVTDDRLLAWLREQEDRIERDDKEVEGIASRHRDTRLQTPHSKPQLERRLLNTYYAARTTIEERGVNTLYLALGMLHWFESTSSEIQRSAPLIMIPVSLGRSSARSIFSLEHSGDEIGDNLSLQAKLKAEFHIDLPSLPPQEELKPSGFFEQVASVIREQPRWEVDAEAIHLGFFWFTKLLMYEDLDPEKWLPHGGVEDHPVLQGLLGDGFAEEGSPFSEEPFLDEHLKPEAIYHIRDADSSQTLAMLDVHAGCNLVIQGPPGTGKSQTISNLIAESIARGRRVLFVAEKMAALDVVKRRLDESSVGDACLEIHSHRTNKRSFLQELERTLKLGKPKHEGGDILSRLAGHRDQLNAYASALHKPIGNSSVTPFQAYGELLQARSQLEGVPPRLEEIEGLADWTRQEFRGQVELCESLQRLLGEMGVPREHVFWSSKRTVFLLPDRDRLLAICNVLEQSLEQGQAQFATLAGSLRLAPPSTLQEAKRLLAAADLAIEKPALEGTASGDAAWLEEEQVLESLLKQGRRHRSLKDQWDPALIPEAWDQDVLALRAALREFGSKWWRVLAPRYRRAIRELRGLCRETPPKSLEDRLALVDGIREVQRVEKSLSDHQGMLGRLFGSLWRKTSSDWNRLTAAFDWLRSAHRGKSQGDLPADVLACVHAELNSDEAREMIDAGRDRIKNLERGLAELEEHLEIERDSEWLRTDSGFEVAFDFLRENLVQWQGDPDSLQDMVQFNHLYDGLCKASLRELAELASHWPQADRSLVNLLIYERHNALIKRALDERRVLALFTGLDHTHQVESFQSLDSQSLLLNRARVAQAHWEALPPQNAGGEVGILRHEMEKKRAHKPIRQLMTEAGEAIQKIKPVFMMSPLSVATFLPPGSVKFDLVIFDEASQVRPVDALGAILRGQQAVVVGDKQQLPPTPFFDHILEEDGEEEESPTTKNLESILGLFTAQGAHQRMLRWHYRSQHDSLIAVSNDEFYENKLFVFPSPDHAREERGVIFHHLEDTVYVPGSKRTNEGEATAVAKAAQQHAVDHPDLTLGVAAFSQAQAEAIRDQVEILRRERADLEGFFNSHPHEPFFVKNLENVQGDERDVILISIGYGRQENGSLWMNFGPLNQEGGERRLNVLITRARQRCEIFSNFRADDLDLQRTSARGIAALKRYLKFAETGHLDMPQASERAPDSVFEDRVAEKVRSLGYEVHPQVGSGGFFIDLAVVDPRRRGRYLLGIECDGRAYHSSRWARDRDRLRQEVLESLGWRLHRVWSTDWFKNPKEQLTKISDSLKRAEALAKAGPRTPSAGQEEPLGAEPAVRRERASEERTLQAEPYCMADLSHLVAGLKGQDLYSLKPSGVAKWVIEVVRIESPIHRVELIRRVVRAAGYQQAGSRLQEVVAQGIDRAVQGGKVAVKGDFLWKPGQRYPAFRNRVELHSTQRNIEFIAPEEIEAAIRATVEAAGSISLEEATIQVARLFGFARTSNAIRAAIQGRSSELVTQGKLEGDEGQLRMSA